MRIGVHPPLKRYDGGIYQYTVTFLNALYDLSTSPESAWEHEFVVFTHDVNDHVLQRLTDSRWSVRPFRPPWAPQPEIDLAEPCDPDSAKKQADMAAWLQECGIELMLYPTPHRLSFEAGIPFVMAIHDLQHLLQPEFPEVSADGEWQRREYVLRNAARTATLLIAESAIGREDILAAYGLFDVTPERVKVLPYLPGPTIEARAAKARLAVVRERYRLPQRYVFYPAQFWPHKNHMRLIEALALLRREHNLVVPLVLTGSATGDLRHRVLREVESRCAALGLADQVLMLGYVSNEEVAGLYAGAEALAMPTFFGPTNIPFLEAWSLDCPVLTSRIRGIVEQVGEAAVTVDPKSVAAIAKGIRELWTRESLRQELIAKGRERLRSYTATDYRGRLADIINEAARRIATGVDRTAAVAQEELRV